MFRESDKSTTEHILYAIPYVRSFYFLGKIHENRGAKLLSVLLIGERAPGREADIYSLAQKLLATFTKSGED